MSKLVRDKIPDIIRETGEVPITRKVEGYDLIIALCQKLQEEVDEFFLAGTDRARLEELADVSEVVSALCEQFGGLSSMYQIRLLKKSQRGGFNEGIIWEGNE